MGRSTRSQAKLDFTRAGTLVPGFVEATLLMGKAYCLGDQPEAAEELFKKLHQEAPSEEKNENALWIAGVYYSLKDYKKGLHWAEQLGEEVAIKDRLRSYFLFRGGETDKAIDAGRRAIKQNDRDPWRRKSLEASEQWAFIVRFP